MSEQFKVKVLQADGSEKIFWTLPGKKVYQILEMMGSSTGGSCSGKGTCGKCKVRIKGAVSEMEPGEQEYLMQEEIRQGIRLACCCTVMGELTIELDIFLPDYAAKQRVLKYRAGLPGQSGVEYKKFFIPGRQNDLIIPLYDRIQEALPGYELEISQDNLNILNRIDRPGRPTMELNAVIFDNKKVQLVERDKEGLYGLALDLGTTSLFAALLNLETGELLAMASHTNMQRIYGEDIISRLTYALENIDGFQALHKVLINNINAMIEDMSKETGLAMERIFKLCVVANPVMLHLFLGLDASGFGASPYLGLFSDQFQISSRDMGLNVSSLGKIIILPQLGGFVGADTTACLLTLTNSFQSTFLLIDIGTNGELVLCHKGKMWASSAAAGPAFEGGAITSGMRAGPGAIERFILKNGNLEYDVIGAGPARGICGSGLVDLLAVFLEADLLTKEGFFAPSIDEKFQLREGNRGQELILVPVEDTSGATPIVLNQEDIRQVQLAKGAIRTALDLLLLKAHLKPSDLEHVYLAGAFGTYLKAESLIRIDMLPPIDPSRVENIGNAAGDGAIMALMSSDRLQEASKIKKMVTYVELANQSDFQERFLRNLNF